MAATKTRSPKPKPKLTEDHLVEALTPKNACRVKVFMEGMDEESRGILERAMILPPSRYTSTDLIELLQKGGWPIDAIPVATAFKMHRTGKGSCRCRQD